MKHPSALHIILFTRITARVVVLVTSFFAAIFGLVTPYFQKLFIDSFSEQKVLLPSLIDHPQSPIIFIVLAFVSLMLAQGLNLLAGYFGNKEAIIAQKKIGEVLYEKVLSLKRDSPHNRPVGETVSYCAVEIPGATILLEQMLPMGAGIFFPLLLAPLTIYYLYGVPLWTTILTMTVVATINVVMSLRQSRFFYRFKQLAAERTGIVNEWVQNIRALRILGWIDRFEKRIFLKREEETANRIKMVSNGQAMNAIAASVTFFINLVAIAALVSSQKTPLDPGVLMALFWIFAVFLVRPFRQLPWFFVFFVDGVTSLQRIQSYLSTHDEGEEDEKEAMQSERLPLPGPRGLIVKNLNSSIGGSHLLKNISFQVNPGEFVAIVGEVGSGKSLLLFSLMREIQASYGSYEIIYHDESLNALKMKTSELRSHFAFVSQEGFVMSASLRQNILFEYDEQLGFDTEITRVLKNAQFDITKEILSAGLETEFGERGVNLSGGQRQRISLARAALAQRPILLLDDCLSAVDVETEQKLIDDLFFDEWRSKTRILITHRLSVLAHADRVMFMKDGQIVATGSFDQLLRSSSDFRDFTISVMQNESFQSVAKTNMPEVEKTIEVPPAKPEVNDGDV